MVVDSRRGEAGSLTREEKRAVREGRMGGLSIVEAAAAAGVGVRSAYRVMAESGGMPVKRVKSGSRLGVSDREEIVLGLARGETFAVIAARVGVHHSTVSRDVAANGGRDGYRAWQAEIRAAEEAKRPQVSKLESNPALPREVAVGLAKRWSPEEISERLRIDYRDDEEMRVSPETIYSELFIDVRRTLDAHVFKGSLRSGQTRRKPRGPSSGERRGSKIPDRVPISERPDEVDDRMVPGHWEGDLIVGRLSRSAIATLVERVSRYTMLVQTGHDHTAATVREAIADKIVDLPADVIKSLTWDQGSEMAQHVKFSIDTNIAVYFCDPHSPWQRGTNENTNGLLRQYFPKGTDLSVHSQEHLDNVAAELNDRPRKVLGYMKPSETFADHCALTG